jgi:hypothetical protein
VASPLELQRRYYIIIAKRRSGSGEQALFPPYIGALQLVENTGFLQEPDPVLIYFSQGSLP